MHTHSNCTCSNVTLCRQDRVKTGISPAIHIPGPHHSLSVVFHSMYAGVLPRSIGVAPEKALKMVAWDVSLHLIDQYSPHCHEMLRWMIGGSAAGAATTIIGKITQSWFGKACLYILPNKGICTDIDFRPRPSIYACTSLNEGVWYFGDIWLHVLNWPAQKKSQLYSTVL